MDVSLSVEETSKGVAGPQDIEALADACALKQPCWSPTGLLLCAIVAGGACLLFQLEPLAGKIITPRFGGTAGTWSVCLLFFQLVVLGGYGLTWALSILPARKQLVVYTVLALTSLCFSRVPLPAEWVATGGDPGQDVLALLVRHLAVPALFLSTISGTMQVWYRRCKIGDPYPLYAVSNVGSLAALLAYPAIVEPSFGVCTTVQWWSLCYGILVALVVASVLVVWRAVTTVVTGGSPEEPPEPKDEAGSPPISSRQMVWWTFLSMSGSFVLMSYTSFITSDIAPVPMLWVLPLSIYLLSFVLVFSSFSLFRNRLFNYLWLYVALVEPIIGSVKPVFRLYTSLLLVFMMCMVCHGELSASRPHPERLPVFYFCLSLGGVIAGVFVALVAPSVFSCELERLLALVMVLVVTVITLYRRKLYLGKRTNAAGTEVEAKLSKSSMISSYVLIAIPAVAVLILNFIQIEQEDVVARVRNFYSAVTVQRNSQKTKLIHGRILHGEQFLDARLANKPTSYYKTPVRLLDDFLRQQSANKLLNVACIGLGTGTLAVYGRTGDRFTFFELDPKIERIANTWFSYLNQSKARIEVKLGDGRTTLDQLPSQGFDLLFVDAFNGDAIPLHLLTKEAMVIYRKHLKPGGIIVFHVTNKYINLPPPIAATGKIAGLCPMLLETRDPNFRYLILAQDQSVVSKLYGYACEKRNDYPELEFADTLTEAAPWTDDFANILSAFRK